MNLMKTATLLMASAVMFSSCKMSYIKRFKKDAKSQVGTAKIKLRADTVRVVYTELSMFDFNKDEVKPEAKVNIQHFANILTKYDRINFIINGYTDNVGTDDVNQSLSRKRAENAKAIFESNGINGGRIQTNGMGSSHPVSTNSTDEGRQDNRRVEFLLYEKK